MSKFFHAPSNIDIINAAQTSDVSRVKSIRVTDNTLLLQSDEKGYTAFHWAAYSDDIEVFDALSEDNHNYLWSCLTHKGMNSLHIACSNNSLRVARRIIEIIQSNPVHQHHIDAVNTYKETALHLAAAANNADIVTLLLESGCNTLILDQWSRTARRVALENGYTATAALLPTHAYDTLADDLPVNQPAAAAPVVTRGRGDSNAPAYATEQTILDQVFLNTELKSKLAIMSFREEDGCSVDSLGLNRVDTHVHTMFAAPTTLHSASHTSAELENVLEYVQRVESPQTLHNNSASSADGTPAYLAPGILNSNTSNSPFNPTSSSSSSTSQEAAAASSVGRAPPSGAALQHTFSDHSLPVQVGGADSSGVASPSKLALSKLVEFPGDPVKLKEQLADPNIAPNGKDMYGLTALMKFASWDKTDLLHLLLAHLDTTQVNTTGGKNKLPLLHYCIDMDAPNTLKALVRDYRVDQCLVDEFGRTFREHAYHTGKQAWLCALLGEEEEE